MEVKAQEISRILEEKIKNYSASVESNEVGHVVSVGDGIARVHGLDKVAAGELVRFKNGVIGIALNLEEESVGVVLMGESSSIREGDEVARTGRIADVPVGEELIGRVVDALGNPIDGLGEIKTDKRSRIEVKAPGIVARK